MTAMIDSPVTTMARYAALCDPTQRFFHLQLVETSRDLGSGDGLTDEGVGTLILYLPVAMIPPVSPSHAGAVRVAPSATVTSV